MTFTVESREPYDGMPCFIMFLFLPRIFRCYPCPKSLNRLSNTWTKTVGNLTDSDAIVAAINSLNGLLSSVNNLTDKLGPLASIGLSAGLFAGIRNTGKRRMSVRIS